MKTAFSKLSYPSVLKRTLLNKSFSSVQAIGTADPLHVKT